MATARKVKKKAVKKVPARKKAARKKKGTKKATKSNAVQRLPKRSEVPVVDRWDLKSLFTGDKAWETAFKKWDKQIDGYKKYQGKLAKSAATLAACLQFDSDFDRAGERLAYYAHLKTAEDSTNGTYQTMMGRYMSVASRAAQAASFIRPEILSIPATKLKKFMANKAMEPWRLAVDRLTRYKPHTLSEGEEKLLAMQIEMAQTSSHTYDQLHDSDMKFDVIRDDKGNQVELGHGTFGKFMESPKRSVRANAYEKYYGKFSDVQHTMAATLSGSIQKDIYYARARNYESALEKALFADRVPTDVYNNLISTVGDNLKALHKYYRLRNRVLKLKKFSLYDQYVSLLPKARMTHTWDEAVEVVLESLKPLGAEYGRTLKRGLTGRRALDAQLLLIQDAAVPILQLHNFRRRSGQHLQRTATHEASALAGHQQDPTGDAHQPRDRQHPRHDLPANDVLRVRTAHARVGRTGPTADDRCLQEDLRRAAAKVPWPHARHRRLRALRVPANSALLPRVLRLQVRHRHVRGDRALSSRHRRWREGTGRLSQLPDDRLLEVPIGTTQGRRCRHDETGSHRSGYGVLLRARG